MVCDIGYDALLNDKTCRLNVAILKECHIYHFNWTLYVQVGVLCIYCDVFKLYHCKSYNSNCLIH